MLRVADYINLEERRNKPMGVKKNRIIALLVAVVMVLCSAAMAFAADKTSESTAQGTSQANKTTVNVSKGTVKVKDATKIIKTSKGKISGTTIKGLKKGDKVTITTSSGKTYIWMTTTKVTKAKKSKKNVNVKWKKVKKATKYVVQYKLKGKTYYKSVGKKTSAKLPKGAKNVKVRPLSKKYVGVWSKTKKVK